MRKDLIHVEVSKSFSHTSLQYCIRLQSRLSIPRGQFITNPLAQSF